MTSREQDEQDYAAVANSPGTIACLRLVSILVAYLVKSDDDIGPHLLRVVRDQKSEATSPEEAKILEDFIEGVERHMSYKNAIN